MALTLFGDIAASQSVQSVQSLFIDGNTLGASTITGGDIYIKATGNITASINGSSLVLSVGTAGGGLTNINVSGGTTSNNLSAVTFGDGGGVSFGLNGSVLTAQAPAGAPSPVNFSAGTTSQNLGSIVFSNSNGISFGVNGSTMTASHNGLTTAMQSNAVTISNINISAGTTSDNLSALTFSDSNGVSFGLNGSVVTASALNIVSSYAPIAPEGRSTVLVGVPTGTSAGVSIYPYFLDEAVSAGIMNVAYSMAFLTVGTSSGRQTMGIAMGIYSLNASTLSSIASTSFSIGVTGNNSSYTINQPTTTAYTGFGTGNTNSAGSNISSGYTGMKLVGIPINTLLPVGQYFLGIIGTNSTSSVNVGISMSHLGAAMGTGFSALAPMGSYSTSYSTGFDRNGGRFNILQGSWTSAGSVTMIPASMAHNSISAVGLTYPIIKFWST
jgi:hypothetical protein